MELELRLGEILYVCADVKGSQTSNAGLLAQAPIQGSGKAQFRAPQIWSAALKVLPIEWVKLLEPNTRGGTKEGP